MPTPGFLFRALKRPLKLDDDQPRARPRPVPGGSVNFWAVVPPEDWNRCVISLDWIASPTRLKKHLQLDFKPADECPTPEPVAIWTEDGMSTSR